MNLSPEKAAVFRPIYEQFEVARKEIGKERILIIDDYIASYTHLGDEEADALATRSLKNDAALNKLYSSYYKKFKKGYLSYRCGEIHPGGILYHQHHPQRRTTGIALRRRYLANKLPATL